MPWHTHSLVNKDVELTSSQLRLSPLSALSLVSRASLSPTVWLRALLRPLFRAPYSQVAMSSVAGWLYGMFQTFNIIYYGENLICFNDIHPLWPAFCVLYEKDQINLRRTAESSMSLITVAEECTCEKN